LPRHQREPATSHEDLPGSRGPCDPATRSDWAPTGCRNQVGLANRMARAAPHARRRGDDVIMSPEKSVTGRRTRLAPKPITGFGHSVDQEESSTANSAGTGQMPDTSLPADPDPRHEPDPARHTLQTAPAAAPPASSSPQEPSNTAPHTETREPLAARALV